MPLWLDVMVGVSVMFVIEVMLFKWNQYLTGCKTWNKVGRDPSSTAQIWNYNIANGVKIVTLSTIWTIEGDFDVCWYGDFIAHFVTSLVLYLRQLRPGNPKTRPGLSVGSCYFSAKMGLIEKFMIQLRLSSMPMYLWGVASVINFCLHYVYVLLEFTIKMAVPSLIAFNFGVLI